MNNRMTEVAASTPPGTTDPRTLQRCIQRVSFWKHRVCSVPNVTRNVQMETGEQWLSKCGEFAEYALVRNGRVSPRCKAHALADAKRLTIIINESPKIELPARLFKEKP